MSDRRITALLAIAAVLASGCASPETPKASPMASAVAFEDPWARAAEMGMTAVFGTLANTGDRDVRLVGGDSPAAGQVEIHEIATDNGASVMRPKEGGIMIAAGGTHELAPGGDHLMLMDLRQALQPGTDVAVTLTFEDGSTLPVNAQVRDFAGGNEEYSPGGHQHG